MGLVAYDSEPESEVDDGERQEDAGNGRDGRRHPSAPVDAGESETAVLSSPRDGARGATAASALMGVGSPASGVSRNGQRKRKTLPSLPKAFSTYNPNDDPAQHQGRKRSRPYIDGDYNMHVFVSLHAPANFHAVLAAIMSRAQALCPRHALHSLTAAGPPIAPVTSLQPCNAPHPPAQPSPSRSPPPPSPPPPSLPLHVSLTHPHPLRRSQIEPFKADLIAALRRHPFSAPLRVSFAGGVTGYVNGKKYGGEGEGGRAFLAVRLAAGAREIERVVEAAVHPLLDKLHLQRYHDNPEFHASFAWCLTEREMGGGGEEAEAEAEQGAKEEGGATPFTSSVLQRLSDEFGTALLDAQPRGGWAVDELQIKVGKEVSSIPLVAA